jgi:hypothetical protein
MHTTTVLITLTTHTSVYGYGAEKVFQKQRPKTTDPSERWQRWISSESGGAFSSLRIAPYFDVEMLPSGQFSLSSTLWQQPQPELIEPVDIESKESLREISGGDMGDDQVYIAYPSAI